MISKCSRLVTVALLAGAVNVTTAYACKPKRVVYCAPPVYVYPSCPTAQTYHAPTPVAQSLPRETTRQESAEKITTVAEALAKATKSFQSGQINEAVRYYSIALHIEPKNAFAYKSRGIVRLAARDFRQAAADLTQAAELAPKDAEPHAYLAFLYGACPERDFRDAQKAVEHATQACEMTDWKNPEYLVALATAHAQAGNFEQAVKETEKALELAESSNKEGLRVVLAQFQRGQGIP